MTPRSAARSCLISAVAVLIFACGAGPSGEAGGGVTAGSLTVVASEFAFDPSSVTVAAAQDVSITLENSGAIEHEWAILKAGSNITSEAELAEAQILFILPSVAAGASNTDSFNLAEGNYQIICTIQGHLDAGMKGELTAIAG